MKFDQVSTQKEDYLVDTIALHDYMGYLCPVFADPSICKVYKSRVFVTLIGILSSMTLNLFLFLHL